MSALRALSLLLCLLVGIWTTKAVEITFFENGDCSEPKRATMTADSNECANLPTVSFNGMVLNPSAKVICTGNTEESEYTTHTYFGQNCQGPDIVANGKGKSACTPPVSFAPTTITVNVNCGIPKKVKVDCHVSAWSTWSACPVSCGSGTQTRSRTIVTHPLNGGAACPTNLRETRPCSAAPCPVACKVSAFSGWSACSTSCGPGTQTRVRSVVTPAAHGGAPCPSLTESQQCKPVTPCPVDCVVSPFSAFSACSATCGPAVKQRRRTIVVASANGGAACPGLTEEATCSNPVCSRDCVTSAWGDWSKCSEPCGGGTQTRTRTIKVAALGSGKACGPLHETKKCNTHVCPVDCKLSAWSKYGTCSKTCGGGTHTRTRTVVTPSAGTGEVCGSTTETEPCNEQPCPIDCKVLSDWGPWSPCSRACAGGTQTRTRKLQVAQNGGKKCPAFQQSKSCNTFPCPINGKASPWGNWSKCSAVCEGGFQVRARSQIKPSVHGGIPIGELKEVQDCNMQSCLTNKKVVKKQTSAPPRFEEVTLWNAWGPCSKTCGGGTMKRTSQAGNSTQEAPCNTAACPVDCEATPWGPWSTCSATCSGGIQTRKRSIKVAASSGGKVCGPLEESRDCNTDSCFAKCTSTPWSAWSPCSKSCGGGQRQRTRKFTSGKDCGATQETEWCNHQPCPVDCKMGPWSPFTPCSATCGHGWRSRTRVVTTPPQNGGKTCGPTFSSEICAAGAACPVDCEGTWNAWQACSKSCGGGTRKRTFNTTRPAANGGLSCLALGKLLDGNESSVRLVNGVVTASGKCNVKVPCPVDCVMSSFTEWSPCSKSCGVGTQTRSRKVITKPAHGGEPCGPIRESSHCNFNACPGTKSSGNVTFGGKNATVPTSTSKPTNATTPKPTTAGASSTPKPTSHSTAKPTSHSTPKPTSHSTPKPTAHSTTKPTNHSTPKPTSHSTPKPTAHSTSHSTPKATSHSTPKTTTKPTNSTKPKDCKLSSWSSWSPCSRSCGTGNQRRYRAVLQTPTAGGKPCGDFHETRPCSHKCKPKPPTPIKITMSLNMAPPTHPRAKSGFLNLFSTDVLGALRGRVTKDRLTVQSVNGTKTGKTVVHFTILPAPNGTTSGSTGPMTAVDAAKDLKFQASSAGSRLKLGEVTHTVTAVTFAQDCVVTEWTGFSECSKTCGGGTMHRVRRVVIPASGGGAACPVLKETANCSDFPCGHDCKVSAWSVWGPCSVTCGNGTRVRTRTVVAEPGPGGKPCPTLKESGHCPTKLGGLQSVPCPDQDCKYSKWTKWTACTKHCGGGTQTRSRVILEHATGKGKNCSHRLLNETQNCNTDPCDKYNCLAGMFCSKDCKVSNWSKWGSCDPYGRRHRHRNVLVKPSGDGRKCPVLSETEPCPVDCIVSKWGDWGSCDKNTGQRTRHRHVEVHSKGSGKACPKLVEHKKCGIDCHLSSWSGWSPCSGTCGHQVRMRQRTVITKPQNGGALCGPLTETKPCTGLPSCPSSPCQPACETSPCQPTACEKPTPTPASTPAATSAPSTKAPGCVASQWSKWSACSATCGGGQKARQRTLTGTDTHKCGPAKEYAPCNTHTCAPSGNMCTYQDYGPWTKCQRVCAAPSDSKYGIRKRVSHPKPGSPLFCHNVVQEERCMMPPVGALIPNIIGANSGGRKSALTTPCTRSQFF